MTTAHRTRVTIKNRTGDEEVDAWDIGVPGLVVAHVDDLYEYSITHVPSGIALGFHDVFDNAVSAVEYIALEGLDWTHEDLPSRDDWAAYQAIGRSAKKLYNLH